MINAQQFAANWAQGMNNATDKMRQGAQNVKTAPGVSALNAKEKMKARWLDSVNSGKWGANVQAVTLQDWQQAYVQKGLPRIADGVRASQGKVQRFANEFLPFIQSLQQTVRAMPKVTPADSEARVLAWMRGMRTFTYNKGFAAAGS